MSEFNSSIKLSFFWLGFKNQGLLNIITQKSWIKIDNKFFNYSLSILKMQKKRIISLILIFFLCSNFLIQVSYFFDWLKTDEIRSPLRISGDRATLEWVSIYDDPEPFNWDQAYDVAIDSLGNVYAVGGSIGDLILVKYNSKGDYILNRTWSPGSGYAEAKAVALDSSNNIYIAGQINLREDMVLLKYNSDCVLQWVRIWGGPQEDPLWDMAIDSSDNIYLAGGTESFSVGRADFCVVKYNSSGHQLWNRTWGGSEYDISHNIAIDSTDDIILGGHTASYGDGYTDMVLLKYNSSGVLQWDLVWERGGGYYEFNDGVVIDSSDNIYAAVSDINNYIPILAKFDNNGNEIWNRTYPGLGYFGVEEMEIDVFDYLYIATTFSYRDFGFAKINGSGDFQWSETWGTADDEFCTSMALNSTGQIYLAGYRSFHSYGHMIIVKFEIIPPKLFNIPSNNIYTQGADYIFNSTWIDLEGTIEKVLFEFEGYNFTVTSNKSRTFTFILNDLSANENGYDFRWHVKHNNGNWTSTTWGNFILHRKAVEFEILFNGGKDNYFFDYNPFINITVINLDSTPGTINLFVNDSLKHQEEGDVLMNISQYSWGSHKITATLTHENYTGYLNKWLYLIELSPSTSPEIPGFDIFLVFGLIALITSFLTLKRVRSYLKSKKPLLT